MIETARSAADMAEGMLSQAAEADKIAKQQRMEAEALDKIIREVEAMEAKRTPLLAQFDRWQMDIEKYGDDAKREADFAKAQAA